MSYDNKAYQIAYRNNPINKARRRQLNQTPEAKLKRRNNELRRLYGIDLADKQARYTHQQSKCPICQSSHLIDDMVIDHNHQTGKVRGLLCNDCNAGIGLLKDNTANLKRAIEYLEQDQQSMIE